METPIQENLKMNRWALILVPVTVTEGIIIKVAATFDAPASTTYQEIIDKLKTAALPATGLSMVDDPRPKKKMGRACPIQIQEVPPEDSENWNGIPPLLRTQLVPFAVFETHSDFANLIGVEINSVTCALYRARKKRNSDHTAVIKGFRISRLEDVYKD